jgi:hypothetical protein
MVERKQIACDVCKVQKKETNHWWIGRVVWKASGKEPSGLAIIPAAVEPRRRKGDVDLCSQGCAHSWTDAQLTRFVNAERSNHVPATPVD